MDFYTTSFTYPRVSGSSSQHVPPSPLDFAFRQNQFLLGQNAFNVPQDTSAAVADAETLQKVVLSASQANTCVISFAKSSQGKGWNFYVSGVYQQVMAARGMVLRECPIQVSECARLACRRSLLSGCHR